MRTLRTLLVMLLVSSSTYGAESPPVSASKPAPAKAAVRSVPSIRSSRWDSNRDGRLDAAERTVMAREVQSPAPTDAAGKMRDPLKKVGPQPDRRAERIQQALRAR